MDRMLVYSGMQQGGAVLVFGQRLTELKFNMLELHRAS